MSLNDDISRANRHMKKALTGKQVKRLRESWRLLMEERVPEAVIQQILKDEENMMRTGKTEEDLYNEYWDKRIRRAERRHAKAST